MEDAVGEGVVVTVTVCDENAEMEGLPDDDPVGVRVAEMEGLPDAELYADTDGEDEIVVLTVTVSDGGRGIPVANADCDTAADTEGSALCVAGT
jgi:hypothetical protein